MYILSLSASASAETMFTTYKNEKFNYKIKIHSSWKGIDINLDKNHIMYIEKDCALIKVRAFKSLINSIDYIVHKKNWDLRQIDSKLNKIIETEKIQIKKNIFGKLLVFEYKLNNKNMLQRTMITRNKDIIYIIECISPINKFYQYEDEFSTALASFNIINSDEDLDIKKSIENINKYRVWGFIGIITESQLPDLI